MKVEQFELTDPLGQHNIFSQFDTGLVYFKLTNSTDIGVWSYRVKLYDNIEFPEEGFTVDISAGLSGDDAVLARAATNVRSSLATLPVILTATVERRGHPVISARVEAEISGPDGFFAHLVLQDGGSDDLTGHDGVYTGHLTRLAPGPGHVTPLPLPVLQPVTVTNQGLDNIVTEDQEETEVNTTMTDKIVDVQSSTAKSRFVIKDY